MHTPLATWATAGSLAMLKRALNTTLAAWLQPSKFPEAVGSGKQGRVWRLIFTSVSQGGPCPGGARLHHLTSRSYSCLAGHQEVTRQEGARRLLSSRSSSGEQPRPWCFSRPRHCCSAGNGNCCAVCRDGSSPSRSFETVSLHEFGACAGILAVPVGRATQLAISVPCRRLPWAHSSLGV